MERQPLTRTSQSNHKRQPLVTSDQRHPEHPLGQLQRTIGNRAVGRWIQAKLRVSQPGDVYEQEADRVAEQVMSMSESVPAISSNGLPVSVHRKCDACASGSSVCPECVAAEPMAQRQALASLISPLIQRQGNACEIPQDEEVPAGPTEPGQSAAEPSQSVEEEEPIQMKEFSLAEEHAQSEESSIQRSPDGQIFASSDIARRIESTKGQGATLSENFQQDVGSKMGADFSGIRIHTDSNAIQLTSELAAHAFTHGKDIYFNAGKYDPESSEGKHLLAHELTHTMQQNNDVVQRLTASGVGSLAKGTCGGRLRKWRFELNSPASGEGYMVQQVDIFEDVKDCPGMAGCLVNPTTTFWEAWRFNKSDSVFSQYTSYGFSDMTSRPPGDKKSGYVVAQGTLKFFLKSTTGDLGDLSTPPASANGGWGPGNAPISGVLPSTTTQPSWWTNTPVEGPTTRQAYSAWHCCGGASDFNVVKTTP